MMTVMILSFGNSRSRRRNTPWKMENPSHANLFAEENMIDDMTLDDVGDEEIVVEE